MLSSNQTQCGTLSKNSPLTVIQRSSSVLMQRHMLNISEQRLWVMINTRFVINLGTYKYTQTYRHTFNAVCSVENFQLWKDVLRQVFGRARSQRPREIDPRRSSLWRPRLRDSAHPTDIHNCWCLCIWNVCILPVYFMNVYLLYG